MTLQRSREVQEPCWNCRDKHLKCDKQTPKCGRCETKNLDCFVVSKRQIFRQGSTAHFSEDQHWVNSRPKRARLRVHDTGGSVVSNVQFDPSNGHTDHGPSSIPPTSPAAQHSSEPFNCFDCTASENQRLHALAITACEADQLAHNVSSLTGPLFREDESPQDSVTSKFSSQLLDISDPRFPAHTLSVSGSPEQIGHLDSSEGTNSFSGPVQSGYSPTSTSSDVALEPFESVQEACLLRYFIEELSPWFDVCDDRRHFQVEVPYRARHCPPLRNAIYAVASRHLSRLPQYRTSKGPKYKGQVLPHLSTSTAVEYMLKCIPALIDFHKICDREYQENIMAAAVILRQYEEIEEEEEIDSSTGARDQQPVNFLAIIQAIIETTASIPTHHSFANAVFWIAIRQEIYYALAMQRFPRITPDQDKRQGASAANKLILFAGDVTRWWLGDRSPLDWAVLKEELHSITKELMPEFVPILDNKADKSKGEIFSTVWYCSSAQVFGAQHYEIARMILIAENPNIRNDPHCRIAHRKVEAQVRSIVLNICGIGLSHQNVSPALVNAVISIILYGEYFTDPREREALEAVIEKTKAIHAWPMRKLHHAVKAKWEFIDSEYY
ncbi:hypothetical protein F9C07_1651442 [Aspergillus flavus]|uniref:Zn(2)-C6 fungal-type domain-containing protein n=2 Tax=Aspergillus flavus TaxID=5059 RepID=A0A7U2MI32_ASPFN|nr:hypothetical protein AFLA_004678 [Aspergillus flavus NRRL3357]QRD84152.1 hypothetical protein F9C07_1651442 [Aspergillus flavus]